MSSGRLPPIQMLRGVAAMLVVIDHGAAFARAHPALVTGPFLPRFGDLNHFGASGVDLFFVISGFVMAHVLGRDRLPGGRDFAVARAIRILPMFWIMSAAYIIACWGLHGDGWAVQAWANMMTLVPFADGGFYHAPPLYVGWTLGFELCFYGFAAIAITARWRRPVAGLLAITLGAAALGMAVTPGRAALAFVANPIFLEFAFGVIVWMLWRRGIDRRIADLSAVAGLALLVLFLCTQWLPGFSVHYGSVIDGESSLLRALEWGLPYALILLGACCGGTSDGPAARALGHVGDASYALYLVHPLVMTLAIAACPLDRPIDPNLLVIVLCSLAVLTAIPLHRFVERPLLKAMRARLVGPRSAIRRPALAAA